MSVSNLCYSSNVWFVSSATLAPNGSGVAVSAGLNALNCPPTTNLCKKHYRLIKHCTPHCGNPLLSVALLSFSHVSCQFALQSTLSCGMACKLFCFFYGGLNVGKKANVLVNALAINVVRSFIPKTCSCNQVVSPVSRSSPQMYN